MKGFGHLFLYHIVCVSICDLQCTFAVHVVYLLTSSLYLIFIVIAALLAEWSVSIPTQSEWWGFNVVYQQFRAMYDSSYSESWGFNSQWASISIITKMDSHCFFIWHLALRVHRRLSCEILNQGYTIHYTCI